MLDRRHLSHLGDKQGSVLDDSLTKSFEDSIVGPLLMFFFPSEKLEIWRFR